jgi:hypothetical protein
MISALYAQICSRRRRFPLRVQEVEVVPAASFGLGGDLEATSRLALTAS